MQKNYLKIGDRFGEWEIIDFAEPFVYKDVDVRKRWVCKCDCGTIKTILECSLLSGRSTSCGCKRENNPKWGQAKHGLAKSKLYHIYYSMLGRCYNPSNQEYKNYGQRGITVCDSWLGESGFINFYIWAINNGYKDDGNYKLTIDRINNDGNYSPDNCRWTNYTVQANNLRTNHYLTVNGETHTVSEWAKIVGHRPGTLHSRISRGWSNEMVISKEKYNSKREVI